MNTARGASTSVLTRPTVVNDQRRMMLLALSTKEEMVVPIGTWGLVNLFQRGRDLAPDRYVLYGFAFQVVDECRRQAG